MRGDPLIVLLFGTPAVVFLAMFLLAPIIAKALNEFSVKCYERFPRLKVLPNSHLAGTQLNYKSSLIFFRILASIGFVYQLYLLVRTLQIAHQYFPR